VRSNDAHAPAAVILTVGAATLLWAFPIASPRWSMAAASKR
jgi:hypothetical protein